MRILLLSLITILSLTACKEEVSAKSPCDGRQWTSSKEELNCRFPPPPIGRWHAVYTEEFAKEHDLPLENVSTDLSPSVDYMEMDVQPYADGLTACLVNMLIKKPNDVAVYSGGLAKNWEKIFHEKRKLAHLIDLDEYKDELKDIITFGLAPRDMTYDPQKTYGIGSSFAFHAENILEGYDYITADAGCYYILSDKKRFPDGWAFTYAKASVWGRHEPRYTRLEDVGRPKGKDFFNSRISINVPEELILTIFKDMPIGGR